MVAESGSNGDWPQWSKWVRGTLTAVVDGLADLTNEVKGFRGDCGTRIATLEERCSPEKMQSLTDGVQANKVSLAKIGGVGLLSGGSALVLLKLVEAITVAVQAGGTP